MHTTSKLPLSAFRRLLRSRCYSSRSSRGHNIQQVTAARRNLSLISTDDTRTTTLNRINIAVDIDNLSMFIEYEGRHRRSFAHHPCSNVEKL